MRTIARNGLIAGGLAVACVFVSVAPAEAETRFFPGVSCEGNGYTTTRTVANYDTSTIWKYGSTATDNQLFQNFTGVYQVHTNYSSFQRTSQARVYTGNDYDFYTSAKHLCDN